jgi:hypothetical protein
LVHACDFPWIQSRLKIAQRDDDRKIQSVSAEAIFVNRPAAFNDHEGCVMQTTRFLIAVLAVMMTAHPAAVSQASAQTAQNLQAPAASDSTSEPVPSSLPVVTFRDGELSIVAFNSSQHEVLDLVRGKTGAIIDIPPGADERVFVHLGPGPARRVLDSLLEGSDFNFILVSPESEPQALSTVVLTRKSPATAEQTNSAETAYVTPDTTGAEETSSQEIVQGPPPKPVEEAPEVAEALSTLASSVVHRASSRP